MREDVMGQGLNELFAKAQEKLNSARHSLKGEFFEDAASRAYYAAYHAISAVLSARGQEFSSHKQTLSTFNRELIASGEIPDIRFKDIQRLFDDRQNGDYDTTICIGAEDAETDINVAEAIVRACTTYLKRTRGSQHEF